MRLALTIFSRAADVAVLFAILVSSCISGGGAAADDARGVALAGALEVSCIIPTDSALLNAAVATTVAVSPVFMTVASHLPKPQRRRRRGRSPITIARDAAGIKRRYGSSGHHPQPEAPEAR